MILCTSGVAVCYVVQVLVIALAQPRSQGPLLLCPSGKRERERTLGRRLALMVLLNFPRTGTGSSSAIHCIWQVE